jgi:hypothetical protein
MADPPLSQVPDPHDDGSDADREGVSPEAPIASSSARKLVGPIGREGFIFIPAHWEIPGARLDRGPDASSSAPNEASGGSSSARSKASGASSSALDASSSARKASFPSWVRPGAPCQALYAYKSDDGHQHFYHAVVKEVQDDRVCVEWVNAIDYNLKGQKIGKWDKTEWVDTVRHPNSITFGDSSTRGESNSIEARTLAASALSLNLLVTEEEKRKRAAEERAAKSSAKQYYEGCRKRAAAKSPARMGA